MGTTCWHCGKPTPQTAWRTRRYCSDVCRQLAWRKRHKEGTPPVPPGPVIGPATPSPEDAAEFIAQVAAFAEARRSQPGRERIRHGPPPPVVLRAR